jgi:hypothetical protein
MKNTHISAMDDADSHKYLNSEELEPLTNFDLEWKGCIEDLKTSDW